MAQKIPDESLGASCSPVPMTDPGDVAPMPCKPLLEWKNYLSGSQPARFLYDHCGSRPSKNSHDISTTDEVTPRPSTLEFAVDATVFNALGHSGIAPRSQPLAQLLSAFRATHYLMTGVEDATIAVHSRLDTPPHESGNVFYARAYAAREISFTTLMETVVEAVERARTTAPIDPEGVLSDLQLQEPSRTTLAHTLFAYHGYPDSRSPATRGEIPEFEIEFHLHRLADSLTGEVRFAKHLFETATIQAIADVFCDILTQGLSNPEMAIGSLPLTAGLPPAEWLGIRRNNYPRDASIVDIFRLQVETCPEAIAIRECSSQLEVTYAQLDHQSNIIATYLRGLHFVPETPVAIIAHRSCEAIVGMLGILKANLAYLPVDPSAPASRVCAIFASVPHCRLVLVGKAVQPPNFDLHHVALSRLSNILQSPLGAPPSGCEAQPSASSLAYIMYTSGSSGAPKGVMVEHRGVVRLVVNNSTVRQLPETPRMAHMSNLTFDASPWEVYAALLNGGNVICIDSATVLETDALGCLFRRERIDAAVITPTLLKQCWKTPLLHGLKVLHLVGEPLAPSDAIKARSLVPGVVYNTYGPTENSAASTIYPIPKVTDCDFGNGVPIGHAISNSGVYVLDQKQRLVPVGVIGELVVTGDGLARGYTDPSLDEGRFVQLTMGISELRAYRTGDLARWRFDGQLEFHGRLDQQVKVRGQRVEVAEIEQAILLSDSRLDGAAVVESRDGHENALVAFIALQRDEGGKGVEISSIIADVRRFLRARLPTYMLPARIHSLRQLPMTASGKLDRRQLVEMAKIAERATDEGSEPTNTIEAVLCHELGQILGLKVRIRDDFFNLGGHSITAMRLTARLTQRLNVHVSVKNVFDHPMLRDLADTLHRLRENMNEIPHLPPTERVKLSFAQGRLWFFHQLDSAGSGEIIPLAVRLSGKLYVDPLNRAFEALQTRHEALRTVFEQQEHDEVYQVVRPLCELQSLEIVELEGEGQLSSALQDMQRPFDLGRQPAWRASLFQLAPGEAVLSIAMHHIICDGWSIDIFCRELMSFYVAACQNTLDATPLPTQYRHFTAWQQHATQAAIHEKQLEYWKAQLKDSNPAEFLSDYPRPQIPSYKAEAVEFFIHRDSGTYTTLQEVCRAQRVTPFLVLLAALRATHFRFTGSTDATIGTPVANRSLPELHDIIGLFVNIQCARIPVEEQTSFGALLQSLKSIVATAVANQDVPFERIVSVTQPGSRDTSRNPLVQILFALHTQSDLGQIRLYGLTSTRVPLQPALTRFDIEFHVHETEAGLRGNVVFASDLFNSSTIACVVDVFQEILRRGLEDTSSTAISCLPLHNGISEMRHERLSTPKSADYPRDMSIVDVWQHQVRLSREDIAVQDNSSHLTYGELDSASDKIAFWLHSQALRPEAPVGVLAPRCCDTIVTFLGILKAGLAYLPLDANAPAGRIKSIVSSTPDCKIVILGSTIEPPSETGRVRYVRVQEIDHVPRLPGLNLPSATSLAYVMYTSGSTGKPKGVMIEHRGIIRLVKNGTAVERLPLPPKLRIAHLSNLAFDASTWEIYAALLNGGTLVCIDHQTVLDARVLGSAFERHAVCAAVLSPAIVRECLEHSPDALARLDFLHVGGDRFRDTDAAAARKLVPIVNNVYGPTENTVLSTIHSVQEDEVFTNGVPIGTSITNSGAFVMDAQQRLVPPGVLGELVVTGDGLARGYTEAVHNNRFIQVTVDGQTQRGYRTGDSVRLRTDGVLECFHRMDRQVKIRGHRVELAEIEYALLRRHAISAAVVVERRRRLVDREETDLVGFITVRCQKGPSAYTQPGVQEPDHDKENATLETLTLSKLRSHLPSYMVPSRIISLDRMPLNANGKIDRRVLESRAQELPAGPTGQHHVALVRPSDYVERTICEEFSHVLGMDLVNATDNFFDLGGHSLMATRVATRIGHRLNSGISVRDLFNHPTPVDLAAKVREWTKPYDGIPVSSSLTPVSLSFAQARLFFLDQLISKTWYLLPLAVRIRGPVHLEALQQAVLALEERHSILRTTFELQSDGQADLNPKSAPAVQILHPFRPRTLPLTRLSMEAQQHHDILKEEQTKPFDLTREPGWRVRLFQLFGSSAEDGDAPASPEYILSIVMHHIVTDGWSVEIICRELALFYSAACRKLDLLSQVKPLAIQYRDFAAWQQQASSILENRNQLEFWVTELHGSEAAEIPADFRRPPVPSGRAGVIDFQIDRLLCEQFNQFRPLTPFMILLSAFRAAHYRLTAVEDAMVGTPIANRNRRELEDIVGFFVNTQCIRIKVDNETSFRSLLQQVRHSVVAAFANQDVPFEQIVSKLSGNSHDISKNPLVQILFAVHSQQNLGQVELEGLATEMIRPTNPTTRLDLEMHLYQAGTGFNGYALFATDLYDRKTVQNVVDVFLGVLKQAVLTPDMALSYLPLNKSISQSSMQPFIEGSDGGGNEGSIVDAFTTQAKAYPDSIAVQDDTARLTYAQLHHDTEKLAAWLTQFSLPAETLVAVLSPRSCPTIVAYLAVLKANLSYVPLDPKLPSGRIEALLSHNDIRLLLFADDVQLPELEKAKIQCIRLSDALRQSQGLAIDTARTEGRPNASSLAYVMFTSGSTGTPKGVMAQHGSIVRRVTGKANLALPSTCRVGHLSNVMFDATTWEVYTALLNGGTVICITHSTVVDAEALGRFIEQRHVQVSMITPPVLKQLLRYSPRSLQEFELLHVIGERLTVRDAVQSRALVSGALYNSYGPTEATILSTSHMIRDGNPPINDVPIGRAIEGAGAYVTDQNQRLVPLGVVGELVLTGPGVARGYTDPALDRDRFIHLKVEGHSMRAYRTGDSVRICPRREELMFLGRMDSQVKVRGQRVELGEIEHAIVTHCEDASDAVVVTREVESYGVELVAFVVVKTEPACTIGEAGLGRTPPSSRTQTAGEVTQRLAAALPAYMVPAHVEVIPEVPLTANGKVDRRRLTAEAERMPRAKPVGKLKPAYVAPQSAIEIALCQTFADILQLPPDEVGVTDTFFDLGGHSLMAMKLAARVSDQLRVLISVRDVFDHPMIVDLAAKIEAADPARYDPIVACAAGRAAPLSFAQSRLWFLSEFGTGTSEYLMPLAARLSGPLNVPALRAAISAMEQRHHVLRTVFAHENGEPVQIVQAHRQPDLPVVKVAAHDLPRALRAEQARPFDLTREPGWRVRLLQSSTDENILSIVMHHIISDGWSVDLLCRELASCYKAARRQSPQAGLDVLSGLAPLPMQYRDFAVWQRESQAQAEEQNRQLGYWKQQLSGSQPAEFLYDHPRPHTQSGDAHAIEFTIEGEVLRRLGHFREEHQSTFFIILLAVFRATHYRLKGTEDATIGMPVANRNRQELQDLIGLFVNIQCIRTFVDQDTSFDTLLRDVMHTTTVALENQDVPFERIVSELCPGMRDRNPLVQVLFALHAQENLGCIELEGLTSQPISPPVSTRLEMEFHVYQEPSRLRGRVLFAKTLFELATGQTTVDVYQEMLRRVLSTPEVPISRIPLTDGVPQLYERGLLTLYPVDSPREKSIVDVFREQARKFPHMVAVTDNSTELTYSQLDKKSEILAEWLRTAWSFPRESLVGVLAPRCCETLIAIVGILKASLAYLPLDANSPTAWTDSLLVAAPSCRLILLTSEVAKPAIARADVAFAYISEALLVEPQASDHASSHSSWEQSLEEAGPHPSSLAYVMFTSGSTGTPKGVMIEHRGIVRLMHESTAARQLSPAHRIAHLANIVFDASVWEIFGALLNGRALVCIDNITILDPRLLSEAFVHRQVEAACMTPSLLRRCWDSSPSAIEVLKVLHIAGEVLPASDAIKARNSIGRHHPRCLTQPAVYNAYGPTENSVASTIYSIPLGDLPDAVPIGQPIDNSGAYVMDSQQRLVSAGVIGELVVTGDGLARGYLQPSMDIGRFIEIDDPSVSSSRRRIRAYRTGDVARMRPDGQLECLGRADQQVKLRGHRIELASVEHATARSYKNVKEAIAVIRPSVASDQEFEIITFITVTTAAPVVNQHNEHDLARTDSVAVEALVLDKLRKQLPSYMVPTQIVLLDSMPLNVNGKVDRRHLAQSARLLLPQRRTELAGSEKTRSRPSNHIETALCTELAGLLTLDVEHVGPADNFFDLGGHSLLASRLVARISRQVGVYVSVKEVFDFPVLSDLARRISELESSVPYKQIPRLGHSQHTELSSAQSRLWFLDQLGSSKTWYLMPIALRLFGKLNIDALETALQTVENRHESLRTTFEQHNGVPMQVVHPFHPRKLAVTKVVLQKHVTEALQQEQAQPFDLAAGPIWRARLFQLESDAHDNTLSIVMHHIVSDGWSVDVLCRELSVFYKAACDQVDPLSQVRPLQIQYRDFAAWERGAQQSNTLAYRKQMEYWLQELKDSQPAELLLDHCRHREAPGDLTTGEAGTVQFTLEGIVYERLTRFCKEHQVTPFVVLLAVFRATHYRFSGVEDATIATPVANRRDREELESLIGFFVNTLCLRIRIDEDTSFRELVKRAQKKSTDAQSNQDIPFEKIVADLFESSPGVKRDLSRNPLVQTLFAFHAQQALGIIEMDGLRVEPAQTKSYTRFDLEFHLSQGSNSLNGGVVYSTALFELKTIETLVAVFRELLSRTMVDPDIPIASVPLDDLVDIDNNPQQVAVPPINDLQNMSIVSVFQRQVVKSPDAIAVRHATIDGEHVQQITYAELGRRSDYLAHWLDNRKLVNESPVAVLARRSCQAVVAMFGIWKASLSYVPLDHKVPEARISSIVSSLPAPVLILVGDDEPVPELEREGVEFVRIREALCQQASQTLLPERSQPQASTLACVFFTSGSSGKPKGVMIEHRGVVRLAPNRGPPTRTAHLTNLAFDVSLWEVTIALSNGGSLVCIDHTTVLDPEALSQVLKREGVQTMVATPALLKQCLYEIPTAMAPLETIYITGDRLDPVDATRLKSISSAIAYNAYGPTENSIESTIYAIPANGDFPNGVPIGTAVSRSGAYVVDKELRIVPPGILGELIVTGDGLARGYTDPFLDKGRFLDVDIGARLTRAYRTGDRVRVRPSDGNLEFFGRLDRQLKIRGHRIELGEVEHTILDHDMIEDAAVMIVERSRKGDWDIVEPEMVAFMSGRADEGQQEHDVDSHCLDWERHFDNVMFSGVGNIDSPDLGRDFLGWTSMFDGKAIDKSEMHEWLDDALRSIVCGQPLGHVLEIGTGTGMVLFNLPEELESYVGLEPSKSAADFVTRMAQTIPHLASKTKIHVGTARDVSKIDGLRPDLVILNSVIQYFPSREYLSDLTDTLIEMPNVTRIFFGDVRSFSLNRQFLAARAIHTLGSEACSSQVRELMAHLEAQEEELLVDPSFFTSLQDRNPSVVKHVEILPKRMEATNELSSYRYTAVVHLRRSCQDTVVTLDGDEWVDFSLAELRHDDILERLHTSPTALRVAFSNIPYQKTILERCMVDAIHCEGQDWFARANADATSRPSMSVLELEKVGETAGFRTQVSWSRQASQSGALDVVFHRYPQPPGHGSRVLFRFPTERLVAPNSCTNRLEHLHQRRVKRLVREHLRATLPSYMLPVDLVVMDKLPLNPNGKVDRQTLTKHAQDLLCGSSSTTDIAYRSPRNEIEAVLCEDFADVLGMARAKVSTAADFFELGGHSLMATRLVARISRRFAKISIRDIFDHPVLADLAAHIGALTGTPYDHIKKTTDAGPAPLSFGQSRLWFLEQLNSRTYLMPLTVKIHGALDVRALESALQASQQRHDTLRTTFHHSDDLPDGPSSAFQVVHQYQPLSLPVTKLEGDDAQDQLLRALVQEQSLPFDLARKPGFRARLFHLSADEDGTEHVLSIVMHHIICDGWSLDVLHREMSLFYSAACHGLDALSQIERLPIQYRDFVAWQAAQEDDRQRQREYWVNLLADSRPAEIPTDFTRPSIPSGIAGAHEFVIDGTIYDSLRQFCRDRRVTIFAVLLAAFRATHYRLTGINDAVVGTPIANRSRQELQGLIGFFVNLQCMRIVVDEAVSFSGLVQQVRDTVSDALQNQDLPFEDLVSHLCPGKKDVSRNPLVQLLFAVHQQDVQQLQLPGLQSKSMPPVTPTTRFDLEVHVHENEQQLQCSVLFAQELYHPDTIKAMVSTFQELLRRGLETPDMALDDLELSDGVRNASERGFLAFELSDYPRNSSIVDLFREQAANHPDGIAVRHESSYLTYGQLERLSEKLANWLAGRNLAKESLVGVLMPRSCEAIVAFLGILRAGLAYLPLDIHAPPGRTQAILSSARSCKLLLVADETAQRPHMSRVSNVSDAQCVGIAEVLAAQNRRRELPATFAENLAYVMFTSGSTGRPKAIMTEHRGVVRLVKHGTSVERLPSAPCIAHMSNIAFDAATWEIYAALLNGGTVVCVDRMTVLDSRKLSHVFKQEPQVQASFFTPALLKSCLAHAPAIFRDLRVVLVGGERLDAEDLIMLRKINPYPGSVASVYGPTENTGYSTLHTVAEDEEFPNGVSIGRAISNSGAYAVDGQKRLVTAGVVGELVVTGDGLARGYMDTALDADSFFQLRLADGQGVRAYRTGDLVRMRPMDGHFDFLGRVDHQLKIRGHRVELGEIEHTIATQEGVQSAIVVVLTGSIGGELELAGFITTRGKNEPEPPGRKQLVHRVHDELRAQLPSYMVPSRIALIEYMPVNANGKVDRQILTQQAKDLPRLKEATAPTYTPPSDEIEEKLCNLYTSILHSKDAPAVGIHDDFFDLGGHSLLATSLTASIRREMNVNISVKDVFERPRLVDLACKIRESTPAPLSNCSPTVYTAFQSLNVGDTEHFVASHIVTQLECKRESVLDVYPLSQIQKNHVHNPRTGRPRDPVNFYWDLPTVTDVSRVADTCRALVHRFDIFRTTFLPVAGTFYQVVLECCEIPVEVHDVENLEVATASSFDLHDASSYRHGRPLLAFSILRQRGADLRVLLRLSHALYDGLSFQYIIHAFHALLNQEQLAPAPPFGHYIKHLVQSREKGLQYWRSLLDGSSMTCLSPAQDLHRGEAQVGGENAELQNGCYIATRTVRAPRPKSADAITPATIFTAACALLLAKEMNTSDVVLGRVVSGRQGLPMEDQNIVGPCTNSVPVRVVLQSKDETNMQVLRQVQQQYLEGIPFETIGFDEIREKSTEWPVTTEIWCASAYHDFSLGAACVEQTQYERGPRDSIHELEIGGVVQAGCREQLHVSVSGQRRSFALSTVERMLDEVCEFLESLSL